MVEKLLAIITVVWFYQSAKSVGENAIQWAVIGLAGFFLAASITHFVIAEPILKTLTQPLMMMRALLANLPGVAGFVVTFFIRKKYLSPEKD